MEATFPQDGRSGSTGASIESIRESSSGITWKYQVPNPPELPKIMDVHHLTPRQSQVAVLLYWRRTDCEIANLLSISPHTAASHVAAVLLRLGAATRRDVEAIINGA